MRLAALLACAPLAAPLAAEPISASAYNLLLEPYALIVDAGTERGIFVGHGLEPRWITREKRAVNASDLKDLLAQGTGVGLSSPSEIFLARTQGLRVKVVAGFVGDTQVRIYAKTDGPLKTPRDLDGRTLAPTSLAVQRQVGYLSRAYGIRAQAAPFGTLESAIAALRAGKADGIITAEARVLALVESGELRLLVRAADYR